MLRRSILFVFIFNGVAAFVSPRRFINVSLNVLRLFTPRLQSTGESSSLLEPWLTWNLPVQSIDRTAVTTKAKVANYGLFSPIVEGAKKVMGEEELMVSDSINKQQPSVGSQLDNHDCVFPPETSRESYR